jgi:hypothetical protein
VPTPADVVTISAPGPYTVTISGADQAAGVTFADPGAVLIENAGSLTIPGSLVVDSGLVFLNEANAIGGVDVTGGELGFGVAGALGSGAVEVNGGELTGGVNGAPVTLSNALGFEGNSTIAAADGTTLIEDASSYSVLPNTTLNFGSPGGQRNGPLAHQQCECASQCHS